MKWKSFIHYVSRDIVYRRTALEILVGSFAITIASTALLLVISFTNSTNKFINKGFHQARPVIGVIKFATKGDRLFSLEEKSWFEKFQQKYQEIGNISWVSQLSDFQIYKDSNEELDDEPLIASVNDNSAVINTQYGIEFLKGKSFERYLFSLKKDFQKDLKIKSVTSRLRKEFTQKNFWLPQLAKIKKLKNKWVIKYKNDSLYSIIKQKKELKVFREKPSFGILLNTRYLKDFLEFSEEKIKKIVHHKNFADVPSHIYIHFPPLLLSDNKAIRIGSLKIPIHGLFSINEYPDIFFNFDVAGAYFYLDLQKWKPEYSFQFHLPNNVPLMKKKDTKLPKNIVTLPSLSKLLTFSYLKKVGKTPYKEAWIWVKNYQKQGIRSKVLQNIQKGLPLFEIKTKEVPKENFLSYVSREFEKNKLNLSQKTKIKEIKKTKQWVLEDLQQNKKYFLEYDKKQFSIYLRKEWRHYIPSDTVSQALNRITNVVKIYSRAIVFVIFWLCGLITLLFGIGHVYRKKKDIGILKTSGMEATTVGKIFIAEVILVCLFGFLMGIICSFLLSFPMETYAKQIIHNLYPRHLIQERILIIKYTDIWQAFLWVFSASTIGGLFPSLSAASINPAVDLSKGV